MKRLNLFVGTLILTLCLALSANAKELNDEPSIINREIHNLLDKHNLDLEGDVDATVYITFNSKKEMVVLSVYTENHLVEKFIKERLNYKKVEADVHTDLNMYRIPLVVKP